MNEMPQSRVLLYLFCFSLLPILLAGWMYIRESNALDDLEDRITTIQAAAINQERRQAANLQVRNYFREADRFYVDKHISALRLLDKESEALQNLVSQPHVAEDPRVTRRLTALAANTPVFSEGMVQSYAFFNEIPETLVHPLEVDVDDIKKLLSKIEGVKIGPNEPGPNRPQLLITDFRLDRKGSQGESDIYTLNFKFIKREYL